MKTLIACGAAALLVTLPAAGVSAQDAKPKKVKKICRTDAASVGSRFTKRLCLTADEWAALEGQKSDTVRQFLDQTEREGTEYNPYPKPS